MIKRAHLNDRLNIVFLMGFGLGRLISPAAYLEARQNDSESVKTLIDQFKRDPRVVNKLADANATEAVPLMKQKFETIKIDPSRSAFLNDDLSLKGSLASALVRLGEKTGPHWDFLLSQARIAVESDAPWPIRKDAQGRLVPKDLSPSFLSWAKAHKIDDPIGEARNQVAMQSRILPLAMTGDVRGLSLLRKALHSPNPLVQSMGAQGLAVLQDKDSIPQIIEACEWASAHVSTDSGIVIAYALVFFDDQRAQRAAGRFVTERHLLDSLREKSRKYGPRGLFR